ncbi:MAG TPA: S9 family peptidase [Vicinamibacterales bacterium]|nr:S9 family peptidase [Vicinamibacterales bacterium]
MVRQTGAGPAPALVVLLALVLGPAGAAHEQPAATPTIDQLISLERVASPAISPDGQFAAFTMRRTMWQENEYETEIWLADLGANTIRQLTSGARSSSAPAWAPDSRRLAFFSDRGERRQIYLIGRDGGEAQAVTSSADAIGRFAWAPDGGAIAFSATASNEAAERNRERTWGAYRVIDAEARLAELRVVDLRAGTTRRLTEGQFTVGAFAWSPDGTRIAFDHQRTPDPADGGSADISIVTVADGSVRPLVTQDGPDTNPMWSPDGALVAFESAMASPGFYYTNGAIAVVPAVGGPVRSLTADFDEDPSLVAWRPTGLYFSASQRTLSYLFRLDGASGRIERVAPPVGRIGSGFTLDDAGVAAAFVAADADTFPEVYVGALDGSAPRRLTDTGAQTRQWTRSTREVISWKSRDGTPIEGVLHKPAGFTPGRRVPLLVVIHGGPTAVSRPVPYGQTRIYPVDLWLARGALVLEPNYRGSAGYGAAFRSLNVRNLGVGDAWDVLAGVDHLIAQGLADGERVGVMGWSQGGYISAFLATHDSDRFKAISVGAGISNWLTYYVNTDIHPFTRQYLQATPWDDPEIYALTSPMTYIKGARTPTLIQHGERDQRVPPPNAFELYQGLRDVGVPTRLILYGGFGGTGHGPTRPRSSRALMQHNLDWFDEHLFVRR